MRKLFTLTLALLASFSLCWAQTATYSYSFASADELNNLTYTAGDASDTWGVYTVKTNGVTPRDGGFAQYKCGKSSKVATFVTKKSFTDISNISFYIASSDKGKTQVKIEISPKADFSSNITEVVNATGGLTGLGISSPANSTWYLVNFDVSNVSGYVRFSMTASSSGKYWSYDDIVITAAPECNAPANALVLSADKTSDIYEGDEITFSTTGGNGGAISIEGADSETITANKWIATVGEHTFTASQAKNGDYCAQEAELVLNVVAATPVTSCTIAGPTAGYAGYELTYTATAANATAFAWYVDDALQEGETDAEFVYTGVKGNHSIYATATNAHTATPVASNTINLTVTKVCGELIKATLKGGTNADMSGVVGGTFDANLQSGKYKLDNGYYMGVSLSSGTFMAGDVVTIEMTTAGQNYPCLFADKDRENLLFLATETSSALTYDIVLPLAAHGQTSIYLSRNDNESYSWNPVVKSISVTRSCEESSDASVESLTVNGVAVAKDAELNKFEYTVSTNYAEENVTVAFTIHPLATSDKVGNTFTIPTPSAGDTNGASFKVTAEDGTQVTYTVFITKAASLSDDATLKELSVAGLTLDPAFDAETTAYTVTKAYEAAMPVVGDVTATANDANAKSVDVALAGNVFTITVTAEDNTTTKDYTITVNDAPAVKKINEVILTNGYSAYILEGQSLEPFVINGYYLKGQDAPTVKSYKVNDGTTWTQVENTITLTGADASTATYSLVLTEVTPLEYTTDKIVFDGTETWVKSGYGWDATKKWKFSKTDGDYSREIAGKTHIEMFLPACDTIVLTEADVASRDIKIYANGIQIGDKVNLARNKDLEVLVKQNAAFMLTIESAQTGGDGGIGAIRLAKTVPTALDNTADEIKAVKFVENGQLFIRRGEKVYTITGEEVK